VQIRLVEKLIIVPNKLIHGKKLKLYTHILCIRVYVLIYESLRERMILKNIISFANVDAYCLYDAFYKIS
jgi:hypothetical protein